MKQNKLLIAIDTGKSATKVVTKIEDDIERFLFKSKVMEISDLGVDLVPNSYIVEYQNKSFLIGDMVAENSCDFQVSKSTHNHLLCIYLSICKVIEKTNAMTYGVPNVAIAINCPLNIYKNKILKNEYQNFIQNNGNIVSIKVNDKVYIFKISSIVVLPEAMGPLFIRSDDFRNKKITLIDIGSLNINYCIYNKLVPEIDSMNIANAGINILRAKIAEKLTSTFGILVNDSDVQEILSNDGYLYIAGIKKVESKEIIEKLINLHVSEMFNFARSRGLTFNNSTIFFVGGGSLFLKPYILASYPLAVIEEDGQFSNCLSFLNILEVKTNEN